MSTRYDLTNFYDIIDGAVDGYHFDMYSFQFNDFPEWVLNKDCTVTYVNDMEQNTPDLIAYSFYGDERLFWVICLANRIMDPFTELPIGTKICIPNFNAVKEFVLTLGNRTAENVVSSTSNRTVSLN